MARPPNPLAALAAAATPVVAAALAAVAILSGGCQGGPAPTSMASSPAPSVGSAWASPGATATATAPVALEPRFVRQLLVLVGAPTHARARVYDLAMAGAPGRALDMPAVGREHLAAMVAAPDGRLAAVTAEGRAWITPPREVEPGAPAGPAWVPLPVSLERPLSAPVLGAAWSTDRAGLILLAGAPGSGSQRTAVVAVPVNGGPATMVEVPIEADGPGIAALAGDRVALVGRNLRDEVVLALVGSSGSFVGRPVEARFVAAGGNLVAIADERAVRVGTVAELVRGILPGELLPLEGTGGVGGVAIAPDGLSVAVVRLDEAGAAARIDLLRRAGESWLVAGSIGLDPADGTASAAWLP